MHVYCPDDYAGRVKVFNSNGIANHRPESCVVGDPSVRDISEDLGLDQWKA
jgi:hypothetical protein